MSETTNSIIDDESVAEMILAASIVTNGPATLVNSSIGSIAKFVDLVCMIDTGITDNSRDVAEIALGSTPLFVLERDWTNDFSEMRNLAFDFARKQNADWIITVDTDEIVRFCPSITKASLKQSLSLHNEKDVLYAVDGTRSYLKERMLNSRSACRWHGLTHETFVGDNRRVKSCVFPDAVVFELPKTAARIKSKLERDVVLLTQSRIQDPRNGRWSFYLGVTMEALGSIDEALEWYAICVTEDLDNAIIAWAHYLAGRLLFQREQYAESRRRCFMGLELAPTSPELFWLAGLNYYRMGGFTESAALSGYAISILTNQALNCRVSAICRDQAAWHELPYDLHAWSLLAIGDSAGAADFRRIAESKRSDRFHHQQTGDLL